MKTLADFINKLDKLEFTKLVDGKLVVDSGATVVSVSSNIESTPITGTGVQVVISIRFRDQHVQTWGAVNGEENKIIVDWYNSHRSLVREIEYQRDRENAEIGMDFWNSL